VSLIARVLGWSGLPQWALELIIIGLLLGAVWYWGFHTEHTIVQTRVIKQQVEVEKRVIETDHSHDQELADLRAYRAAHPVQPVRVCQSAGVPIAAPRQSSAASADVQPMPGPDPGLRPEAGPDIGSLLGLLALRADEVSATLRRRQALEP
jgi:hypothetical protein